jgi:uroporphyrinogen-III synthase
VFPDAPEPGGVVLFPRAADVSGTLTDGLRSKGWRVDEVVAYRTAPGTPDPGAVADARRADAVAFTSSSTVRRTVELLGIAGVPPVVVSIGPATTAAARAAGLAVAAEADRPTIVGLVAAMVAAMVAPPGDSARQGSQR